MKQLFLQYVYKQAHWFDYKYYYKYYHGLVSSICYCEPIV